MAGFYDFALGMKRTNDRMMQFVSANLKVHLGTIYRLGVAIIKAVNGLNGIGRQEGREGHGRFAGQ